MTESLYGLFLWKAGNYEFEQEENVPVDADDLTPLRAESVLMEGFRMVDEWPDVRKKISHEAMTFETVKPLPAQKAQEKEDDFDASFDDAFSEEKKDENKGEFKSIGSSERRVYGLIDPGRDVRKLMDLSCLGEFETCKALFNLLNLDYIRVHQRRGARGPRDVHGRREPRGRAWADWWRARPSPSWCSRPWASSARGYGRTPGTWAAPRPPPFSDPAAQRLVARAQRVRIEAALEVFRLEKGDLPENAWTRSWKSGLLQHGGPALPLAG